MPYAACPDDSHTVELLSFNTAHARRNKYMSRLQSLNQASDRPTEIHTNHSQITEFVIRILKLP